MPPPRRYASTRLITGAPFIFERGLVDVRTRTRAMLRLPALNGHGHGHRLFRLLGVVLVVTCLTLNPGVVDAQSGRVSGARGGGGAATRGATRQAQPTRGQSVQGRGLHSSTSQLNLSRV